MSVSTLKLLAGGLAAAALAAGLSWLLTNEQSPFAEYLLWHPQLRNFWGMLNFPSYLVGALASGNPHDINEIAALIAFFIQWSLLGILIAVVAGRIFVQPPR